MPPHAAKAEPKAQEAIAQFQRGIRAVLLGPPGKVLNGKDLGNLRREYFLTKRFTQHILGWIKCTFYQSVTYDPDFAFILFQGLEKGRR